MANTRYPMPTVIIHGGNNFPKMISECRKSIKDLEEVNYVQFTMVENLRLNLDEAQEDLRKVKASIHQCHEHYHHNTQHNDIHCCDVGHTSLSWTSGQQHHRELEREYEHHGERKCYRELESPFVEIEHLAKHSSSSFRPMDISEDRYKQPMTTSSEDQHKGGIHMHEMGAKVGGGELKEQAEEPPTMTPPMTEPMITMASFVDTPTNEVFLKLVEKCPELAPRGFQKGSMTTLKYKAAIDNEEVTKATHRLSPDFTGDPTDEAHVLKYLAECGTWTAGLSYNSAVELGKLRGVRHTPTQDPFTD
ncbi:hypothetical protein NEOLEDRAFT_1182635 [Neolentinus lepideus HHB14362 ss-1]|uniref:Uncharacterized protein n=1 Tax=Neolentinus lepideus HHB14362 ss-1 TaxID=1314782 RepID=A0A165NZI3_9AGAM|nr:hypothetical protein NEOLEDRAFT_1182635 [Neolentinus lepideus HHB14362 ss-1]